MKYNIKIGKGDYLTSALVGIGASIIGLVCLPFLFIFALILFVALPILGILGLLKLEKSEEE